MFLSMAWNFGFLLMAIERLRNEVVDLALVDDLTGVANGRELLGRLEETCALSQRSGESFVILVVDLDGFKQINDTHGHAAGDACLRHFTLMTQMQLRPGDLLARTGGDEFCILLPATTLGEGAEIARRVLNACREDAAGCAGADVPIAASIGLAQWTKEIGACSERLPPPPIRRSMQPRTRGKTGMRHAETLHRRLPRICCRDRFCGIKRHKQR